MARRTPEETQQTREKLLDAALEVFWEEGVARPSLTKVAERAGMTRGAIYGHFKNKADVFNAICDRIFFPTDMLEQLREEGAEDPLGTLQEWVTTVLRRRFADPQQRMFMDIIFLRCEAIGNDDVRERLRQNAQQLRLHERELMQRAIASGQLPADLNLDLATLALGALLSGLLRSLSLLPPAVDAPGPWIEQLGKAATDLLHSEALRKRPGETPCEALFPEFYALEPSEPSDPSVRIRITEGDIHST
ncbi:TetR family transcriptional regulator [Pseudenhygromyxa sp. WMMC2535]|uniref:TetR family transcriptional regulator n=1 Tax=Pseudenhygromyxa sp. WMMC2535 TaxID=2712867 RepID=UPI0015955212|nr:TetR family transcriptional regulator [Pseudenhygromyxa sp. WMMC2535]NVB40993.1 TetR family transcriptional regulator [Pseudenhygromyxa sp. WMMC2535]